LPPWGTAVAIRNPVYTLNYVIKGDRSTR
jgi:hypothetical protein